MAHRSFTLLIVGMVMYFLCSVTSADVPHMINYQGKLTTSGGGLVNDTVQILFSIYPDSLGSPPVWTETHEDVVVKDGILSVLLGSENPIGTSTFDGNIKYLGITVESDPEMRPLTPMASVPYAYRTGSANGGACHWSVADSVLYTNEFWGIARGGCGNVIYGDSAHTIVNLGVTCTTGTSSEDYAYCTVGGGLGNLASAYSSTVAGGWVNKATGGAAFVGGGLVNTASGEIAAIGGGYFNIASGYYTFIGGGISNNATSNYATVGGGYKNYAGDVYATVSGGSNDTASSDYATVGGGYVNKATGYYSTVAGGGYNTATGSYSTVGGGYYNNAKTESIVGGGHSNVAEDSSTVGGGVNNSATGNCATIAGGISNMVSSAYSAIGGGYDNTISSDYSVIPGGRGNILNSYADYSMAFGRSVLVDTSYCAVFFDSLYHGHLLINRDNHNYFSNYPIRVGTSSGNGGGAYLTGGGVWTNGSSRWSKEDFENLDGTKVLDDIESMPMSRWKFIGTEEHHISPMAQDFYRAFGCGVGNPQDDSSYIAPIDVAGVSLLAIKELSRIIKEQQLAIEGQRKEIQLLQGKIEALETGRR